LEQKPFSFKDRLKSFSYAFKGLIQLLKKEHNSRIHLSAAAIVVTMGFYFKVSTNEWLALIIIIGMVILSELFNTAIERMADFVEPNWNEKIGEIKDYASAAVLVASITAAIIGIIIFTPKIFTLF